MADPRLADRLEQAPLFRGLRPKELALLTLVMREVSIKAQELLFRQGDEGTGCYFILSGAIEVSREQMGAPNRSVHVLRENELFGHVSLIDALPRSATCRALEDSVLLFLDTDNFEMLFQSGSQFAFRFQTLIAEAAVSQLRQANAHLNALLAGPNIQDDDAIARAQSILEGR